MKCGYAAVAVGIAASMEVKRTQLSNYQSVSHGPSAQFEYTMRTFFEMMSSLATGLTACDVDIASME